MRDLHWVDNRIMEAAVLDPHGYMLFAERLNKMIAGDVPVNEYEEMRRESFRCPVCGADDHQCEPTCPQAMEEVQRSKEHDWYADDIVEPPPLVVCESGDVPF